MSESLLFGMVLTAIAVGYVLGRWDRKKRQQRVKDRLSKEYFIGLNYLLNEQTDEAIDIFIKALEINPDSHEAFETCIALGRLFCRRGEVQRAIQIHQSLLARPSLNRKQSLQVQLELARDYLSAGVLDRAESLFLEVVKSGHDLKYTALQALVEIYQQEKEWEEAINIADQLVSYDGQRYITLLAHFCCEQAELCIRRQDYSAAKQAIKRAMKYDKCCARAYLILGRLEFEQENYKEAIKVLQQIFHQDPDFISESVPLLIECDQKAKTLFGINGYLSKCLKEYPSISVVLALAQTIREKEGDKAAGKFIAEQLVQRPSLRGLNALIDLHIANTEGKAKKNLGLLRELTERLVENKPIYRCHHCGFAGKELHWLCPSCHQWGKVKPIRGIEGQ
ncbi:lipopolysaccharide assembly protein LapB [Zooshikella marina]|uniref:Lipopolysaccharide assembly protein B n=1 Tax=Zooshikella ganghwensis TaxID=202772 RepID=A0A4P9VM21_9GAMM|nr:lipopolysaccharide assembly protein LapB [Zooshikella ganghwensis]MBU2704625.1 lipopolysaccharide assembly protein LapB [Zooshikella ganghwensis]RDH43150.1 lipopolysaccharide assembly protein LapB [Zooshikella ganghwensis]